MSTRGVVVFAVLSFIWGSIIGVGLTQRHYINQTIEHNCAHYDSKTGEHTWNTENGK